MTELELRSNGELFTGWKEVRITRSIEQLASSFGLQSSELWTERDEEIPLREGALCSVWAGNHRVLAGYIDEPDGSYDADSHNLSVTGRSVLCDLIDCSAVVDGGWIKEQTIEGIAGILARPFGITVKMEAAAGETFRRFAIQEGETGHEALGRAAKARGLILMDDDEGRLVITTAGTARAATALEYGVNIKTGSRKASWVDRFSTYTVKSQNAGDNRWKGRKAAQISATVTDDTVDRHRPFVMVAEAQLDQAGCEARARWERNTRAGRSQRLNYVVLGWEDGPDIWTPNKLVAVKDSRYGIDNDLLLVTVVLSKSDLGELTELTLVHPSAFSATASPPRARGGKEFW